MNDVNYTNAPSPQLPRKKPTVMWWIAAVFLLFLGMFCYQLFGPNDPIVVSKETTYITAPLRPNGRPDYRKYAHDKLRNGVTPENNAAVILWRAVGPGDLDPNDRVIVAKELGVSDLPNQQFLTKLFGAQNRQLVAMFLSEQLSRSINDSDEIVYDAIDAAVSAPWSSEALPPIAAWIRQNQHQLDMVVQGSKRSRFYFPSASLLEESGDGEWNFFSDGVQSLRDGSYALHVRAMWNLGENRHEAAWQDLLAVHRYARLLSQDQPITNQLVALAIDGYALEKTTFVLADERLPLHLARQILFSLEALPPSTNMADSIDGPERIWFLSAVLLATKTGAGTYLDAMNMSAESGFKPLDHVSVDWNVTLRHGNLWHDRLASAFRSPKYADRMNALAAINAEMARLENEAQQPAAWAVGAINRCKRSELVATSVAFATTSLADRLASAVDREDTKLNLVRLAAALAVYRGEHGRYPPKLDELVPAVLPKLHDDLYNSGPFIYHPRHNGYLLYSAGPNGFDDSGSNEQWDILAGRKLYFGEDSATQKLRQQIPAGADDLSIRVPRPPFKLPTPLATTTSQQ